MLNDPRVVRIFQSMEEGVYFTDLEHTITFWNNAAEKISGFTAQEVVGRSCKDNILMHVDDEGNSLRESMCPLTYTMEDHKERRARVYLHHKNGHRIPVMVWTLPQKNEKEKTIRGIELFTDISAREKLKKQVKELEKLAMLDYRSPHRPSQPAIPGKPDGNPAPATHKDRDSLGSALF